MVGLSWHDGVMLAIQFFATTGVVLVALINRTDEIRRKLNEHQQTLETLREDLSDLKSQITSCEQSIDRAHNRIDMLYMTARGGE